jgi:hypothetical protein
VRRSQVRRRASALASDASFFELTNPAATSTLRCFDSAASLIPRVSRSTAKSSSSTARSSPQMRSRIGS